MGKKTEERRIGKGYTEEKERWEGKDNEMKKSKILRRKERRKKNRDP